MKFAYVMFAAGISGLACLPASADDQTRQQATTQAVGALLGAFGAPAQVNTAAAQPDAAKSTLNTAIATEQQKLDALKAQLLAQPTAASPAAAAAAPTTQPAAAANLAAFAGKWSVKLAKAGGNTLDSLVNQAIPAETWTVTAKDGKLAITLEPAANAKKKTAPVALNVTAAKLDAGKLTLTITQTHSGTFASETTTTTYLFPLTSDATLTGTFARDMELPNPLGTTKHHDEGTVTLTKL